VIHLISDNCRSQGKCVFYLLAFGSTTFTTSGNKFPSNDKYMLVERHTIFFVPAKYETLHWFLLYFVEKSVKVGHLLGVNS